MALVGKEKIVHLIVNTALALSVATGCTQKAEAKLPVLAGNERTTLPSREVDCEDLGKLNMSPPSKEDLINGFRVRIYASSEMDLLFTASARASVMNGSPIKEVDWKPNKNTTIEMDFSQKAGDTISYSGSIVTGINRHPESWQTSTKTPHIDGCIVATTLVKDGKIDPTQTKIYSLPGTRGTAG